MLPNYERLKRIAPTLADSVSRFSQDLKAVTQLVEVIDALASLVESTGDDDECRITLDLERLEVLTLSAAVMGELIKTLHKEAIHACKNSDTQ